MSKLTGLAVSLLLILLLAQPAFAEKLDAAAITTMGKGATVLIEVGGTRQSSGSGFCVHESGLFLTNAHVVRDLAKGGSLRLILLPGEDGEQVFNGEVLVMDEEVDLALVRIKEQAKLTPLKLGNSDALVETQQVYTFGFPFGKMLSFEEKKFPAITITMGRVTALRKKAGKLEIIQVDADLNPGNSGGPVLNEAGEIIGIVQAGVPETKLNFLIPVAKAKEFLSRIIMTFQPPELAAGSMDKAAKFEVKVVDFLSGDKPLEVELTVTAAGQTKAKQKMTGDGKQYAADVVLEPKKEGPTSLPATVEYEQGRLEGKLEALKFKSGEEEISFDSVTEVTGGAKPQVTLRAKGEKKDIGADTKMVLDVGPLKIELNLAALKRMKIASPGGSYGAVKYLIVATRADQEVGRLAGMINVAGAVVGPGEPQAGGVNAINPAKFEGDRVVRKCPETMGDIVDAANGKFLICHFPKLKKIGIFDTEKLEFVRYIPAADDSVRIAAGRDKLLVALLDANVLQRWDLTTFSKEAAVTIKLRGSISTMAMGSDSAGPLAIVSDDNDLVFLDIATMNPVAANFVAPDPLRAILRSGTSLNARVSADGTVFAFSSSRAAVGSAVIAFKPGGGFSLTFMNEKQTLATASPDGKYVYTGSNVYTRDVKRVRSVNNETLIPARHGDYCLGLAKNIEDATAKITVSIYNASDQKPLASGVDLGITSDYFSGPLTIDKRIWCIPLAKVFVIVPPSNDRFVVYRFDPEQAMEKSGVNYILVKSTPPASVKPGETFTYQVDVKSKRTVKFKLEGAPDGMQVSGTGLITWKVPQDIAESKVSIILRITDETGQEVYHNFELKIVKP
jgi:hypothetical protein